MSDKQQQFEVRFDQMSDGQRELFTFMQYYDEEVNAANELPSFQSSLPLTFDTDSSTAALVAEMELMGKLQDLQGDFSSMMTDIGKDLADCDIRRVQSYLNNVFNTNEFHNCKNIDEVLHKFCHDNYLHTFNTYNLKFLVRLSRKSNDAIQKYEEKKEEFFETTTVTEFQQAVVRRAQTVVLRRMTTVTIRIPEEYCSARTTKDVEELAMNTLRDRHMYMYGIRIIVIPNGVCGSLSSKEEIMELQQEGAIDLEKVSESKLLIQQHIQKQGQLKGVCSFKMLLCGPPETGKTTTMLRLTNNLRCIDPDGLQLPSTVLDKPRTIQLRHMLIGDEKIWNFEESVKKLGQSFYSLILNPSHATDATPTISDATSIISDATPTISDATSIISDATPTISDDRAGSSARQDTAAVQNIDLEEVTQLAEAEEWVEVKKKLTEFEHITILYVIDSGGQPECHEILPLLLDGHILSLLFLDLTKELDDKHPVLFRTGETTACTWKPTSDITTGEVIQRILASVSSLRSDRYKSFAVFVGTYLDKATQRQVLDLDSTVQSAFKVFIDENIVCPVEEEELTEYIVTLNNTSNDQGDIERLRTLILTIINEEFRKDQDGVPTGWMLLHLILRHKYQEKGWCTMAECIATAVSCGIAENELPLVLKYIHKNYGTILYYPDVLEDIVICDPDVILSPLKSAFEFVFACKTVTKKTVIKRIQSTGEISQDDLEYCFKKDRVSLSTPGVIALFKHCHILCETGCKEFFMPCLLQTDKNIIEEANDPQSLASLNPAPILFVPTSEIQINCATPLGVFSALAVEMSADGKWKCNKSEFCFKNRIQFDVVDRTSGRTYTIELRLYATYIEVRHIHGRINTKVLVAFHHELCEALDRISQQFGHTKGIEWNWGFYCPGSLSEGGRPHLALVKRDVPAVQDMTCIFDPPCGNRIIDLEEKHKRWFEDTTTTRQQQHCDLNQECSDIHFAEISVSIVDWREIAPFLGLTEAEEIVIRDSTPNSIPTQKMAMLRKWKQKFGTKATYKQLCLAFDACKKRDLVELVKQLAASSSSSES